MNFSITNLHINDDGVDKVVRGAFGYGPHYTFNGNKKKVNGVDVYQIVAISEFYSILPGTVGGWLSSDDILSQEDRCWVDKDVVVIGGSISGTSYISGTARCTNTLMHNVFINEVAEQSDNRFILKDSDLTNCILNSEGEIINSKLDRIKINEYTVDDCDVCISGSVLDRVVIDSVELKLKDCKLTCLDMSLVDEWEGIELVGMVSRTRRPEICFSEGDNLPDSYMKKQYSEYLPLGEYDLKKFQEALSSYAGFNKSNVIGVESYRREDIDRLLKSVNS